MDTWIFQDQGKRFEVIVNGTLSTTSGEVVHDWVRAGTGISLKAAWDLQPELAAGKIVQCLSEFWCDEIDLFAICANRQHLRHASEPFLILLRKNNHHFPQMIRKMTTTARLHTPRIGRHAKWVG
jgi:DNA-binding transcriptional LysR family regulator